MRVFDVEAEHIKRLEPRQLVRLLRQLLYLEAERHGIPRSATNVPLQICVPDGGEDGRIQWKDGPERTDFVPNRFTVFQSKAQKLTPAQCAKEIAPEGVVKPQVTEVLDAGGAYILFCCHPYNRRLIKSRTDRIRDALKNACRDDWDTVDVEFWDGNKIASWVNSFFPAQVYVFECNRIALELGVRTWQEWASHHDFQTEYVSNPRLNDYIVAIRTICQDENRKPLRVTGLSGLGKTRLALEAFRPIGDDGQYRDNVLHHRVVYMDAALLENPAVAGLLNQLVKLKKSGILVVDNCESVLDRQLVKELGYRGGERISLVTLDFEPDEGGPAYPIVLKPEDCEGVVKGIVSELFPGIGGPETSRIEELAQGFASMAVLIGQQMTDAVEDIGRVSDEEIINRLVKGRGQPDRAAVTVVTTCSLFEYFEFSDETTTDHVTFMAGRIAGVDANEFFAVCKRMLRRGILQRRGQFARICPIPLALTLAANWIDERPRGPLVELIATLKEQRLFEPFCNQVTRLSFSKNADQLVASLIGPDGPFGNPEALLTEEGSRLFRALVEVNPQITTETLWRVLKDKSRAGLLDVSGEVRRNLVWSLEKLCWWSDTFPRAARMMLALAAAENETWNNNASGEFLRLFHVALPGTEADLASRLDVVKEALKSDDPEEHKLGVKALGSALETQSFSRSCGPETQGSRAPRRDYNPTGKETREYLARCIELLVAEIIRPGPDVDFVLAELAGEMRGLLGCGMIDEIEAAIQAIVGARGKYWPEGLVAIRNYLDYDAKDGLPEWIPRVARLEKMLLPESIEERLRLRVSIPDWRDRKTEGGDYVSVAAEEAEKLAEELSQDTSWYSHIGVLLKGEQRQTRSFGRKLGELVETPQLFVDTCLEQLRTIPAEEAAPEVVGAFLAGVEDTDFVATTLDRILTDEALVAFSVRIIGCLDVTEPHFKRLASVIGNSRVPITDFEVFSYGRALDKIGAGLVSEFCDKLAACSVEGARCALHVLYMYCHRDETRFNACSTSFRKLIMVDNLLPMTRRESMLSHYWEASSVKLLTREEPDTELAKYLVQTIVDIACEDPGGGSLSTGSAKGVLRVILKDYFAECWPIVGNALVQRRPCFVLGHLLGMGSEKDEDPKDAILDELPVEALLEWCEETQPARPRAIADIVPIFATVEEPTWHPLAKGLIDRFGHEPGVLDSLSANMFSFFSAGSRAPYYGRRIELLKQLLDHGEAKVRTWAEAEIKRHEREQAEAIQRTEEWKWGIIDRS